MARKRKLISAVIPCYNEESGLHELYYRLGKALKAQNSWDYEIILVDDGSSDKTRLILEEMAKKQSHVVAVLLSRNHGHQLALSAGLSVAKGDRIFILDADLQDPPEVLGDMMKVMDEGAHVVYGQRRQRDGESLFKKVTAKGFYRFINWLSDVPLPVDTGDFRLMSRQALDELNRMPEQHRYIRGMISWVGLKQEPFLYDRAARYADETKYPLRKMIRFALDAITSFSIRPLRIAAFGGFLFAGLALIGLIYIIWGALQGNTVSGWASVISVILICSSIQMFVLGIMGEYLGRLYMQSKGRPLFVIEKIV